MTNGTIGLPDDYPEGYLTPPDLTYACERIRAWIEIMGMEHSTEIAAEWFRLPEHRIPWFTLKNNVRNWLQWLQENTIKMICAEIRVFWFSFVTEVEPHLDDWIADAKAEAAEMEPPSEENPVEVEPFNEGEVEPEETVPEEKPEEEGEEPEEDSTQISLL